jgi:hypothetical protein
MRLLPYMFWFLISCAGHNINVEPPPAKQLNLVPDTTGVMALIGFDGMGHACPIEDTVLSARHMLESRFPWGKEWSYYMWADGKGNEGWGRGVIVDKYQDMGMFQVTGTPSFYPIGSKPKVGDKVWWVQFKEGALSFGLDEVKSTTVKHVRAGHIVIADAPNPGASGSCLLNQAGEAVGIVVWKVSDKGETSGVAVDITE